jgi:CRP-like cAMP-binding protein
MSENLLIDRLPRRERLRLLNLSETVTLRSGDVLCKPGDRIGHMYFPLDSIVSLAATLTGSQMLGIGMVGREGVLGSQLALGLTAAPVHAVVQGAGTALRVQAGPLRRELAQGNSLHRALCRHLYVLMTQFATTAACTCFHLLSPRLARWLLMSEDRAQAQGLHLTHEFLARMLGVRREGISVAAGELQQRLLIRYHRGDIHVLDRAGLEQVACDCYAADRLAYDTLLGMHEPGKAALPRSGIA